MMGEYKNWATAGDLQVFPVGTPAHHRKPHHRTVIARFCEYGDGMGAKHIRRAIAAHNATAGIPTETLEADVVKRMRDLADGLCRYTGSLDPKLVPPGIKRLHSAASALLREIDNG